MDKDFDRWNKKKKEIHYTKPTPLFSEREVWWCSIGLNIGFEEDGKNEDFERPVIILKKFSGDVFIGLPITSSNKTGSFYFEYVLHGIPGSIILSHSRLLSSKRLNRKPSKISRGVFKDVKEKYLKLFL